jgi:hypothetical protein
MSLFLTFISLFAISWSIVSVLMFRHDRSIFDLHPVYSFFGRLASTRKYSDVPLARRTWYHKLNGLYRTEKFLLSTTLLVSITDGLHLCQLLATSFAICAAISFPRGNYNAWDLIVIFIVAKVVWSLTFALFFNWALMKPKYRFP